MSSVRLATLVGCIYEAFALITDRVPTITTIVKNAGKYPGGRFVVWMWCGFIAWHFLEPEPD